MSDDLVKQLQNPRPMSMFLTRADQAKDWTELLHTAADRIEELEAKLAQQDDLVQAAVAAERERCAKVAQRCADFADTNGDYLLICNVVAAIREGGK